jgi:hypothetical protein
MVENLALRTVQPAATHVIPVQDTPYLIGLFLGQLGFAWLTGNGNGTEGTEFRIGDNS